MELTTSLIILILGLGFTAGTVSGFVGIGGGIIMVPVLLEVFRIWGIPPEVVVQAAMGTSLTAAVFSVSSSTIRHHRQKRVMWKLVPMLAPGCLAGGLLAARLAVILPGRFLELALCTLMIVASVRMFTEPADIARPGHSIRWWQGLSVGSGVGLAAGMSGLAGGVVLVPALGLMLRVPSGWLAGTSSATIIFSSSAAALGYLTAPVPVDLGAGFLGFSYLPIVGCLAITTIPGAQFGAWLNKRVGSLLFRRIFSVLMLAVAIRLIFSH